MVWLKNLKQPAWPGLGPCPGAGSCRDDDSLWQADFNSSNTAWLQYEDQERDQDSLSRLNQFPFSELQRLQNPPEGPEEASHSRPSHDDPFSCPQSPAGLGGCCHANLSAGGSPGRAGS